LQSDGRAVEVESKAGKSRVLRFFQKKPKNLEVKKLGFKFLHFFLRKLQVYV